MKITPKMLEEFKTNIKAWKHNENTKDLKNLYTEDRKQLMSIYNLCKKGKFRDAGDEAYWLDTAVRDQIPRDIYNQIMLEKGRIDSKWMNNKTGETYCLFYWQKDCVAIYKNVRINGQENPIIKVPKDQFYADYSLSFN